MDVSVNHHLLFVYGTLKQQQVNHEYLKSSCYMGNYITAEPDYGMLVGEVPYVYRKHNGNYISGEVYKINEEVLNFLDIFEENNHVYQRNLIAIDRLTQPAWCYLLLPSNLKDYSLHYKEKMNGKNKILSW